LVLTTGWELRVAPSLDIAPKPTARELTALRDLQARTAAACLARSELLSRS
jgi:hypothetical protein